MLIETNLRLLFEALQLVGTLNDTVYRKASPAFSSHRVGAHLRHILEFYECFLDGLASRHVDYESRKRNPLIEEHRHQAMESIRSIIRRMENSDLLRTGSIIWVRMEDALGTFCPERYLASSAGRELQVLSSHTVHHFALIAMTLKAHGVLVDPDFGMAPSTLRHMASLQIKRELTSEAAACAP
jgi:hypothetical protein